MDYILLIFVLGVLCVALGVGSLFHWGAGVIVVGVALIYLALQAERQIGSPPERTD